MKMSFLKGTVPGVLFGLALSFVLFRGGAVPRAVALEPPLASMQTVSCRIHAPYAVGQPLNLMIRKSNGTAFASPNVTGCTFRDALGFSMNWAYSATLLPGNLILRVVITPSAPGVPPPTYSGTGFTTVVINEGGTIFRPQLNVDKALFPLCPEDPDTEIVPDYPGKPAPSPSPSLPPAAGPTPADS